MDPHHAFLGQAPPIDFCNTTRRASTPTERSILVRESKGPRSLRTPACTRDASRRPFTSTLRHRSGSCPRAAPCRSTRWVPRRPTSHIPVEPKLSLRVLEHGPGAPERRTRLLRRAPLLEHHPSTRVTDCYRFEGAGDSHPSRINRPKIRFHCRPAKGDSFQRIGVLFTVSEPALIGP